MFDQAIAFKSGIRGIIVSGKVSNIQEWDLKWEGKSVQTFDPKTGSLKIRETNWTERMKKYRSYCSNTRGLHLQKVDLNPNDLKAKVSEALNVTSFIEFSEGIQGVHNDIHTKLSCAMNSEETAAYDPGLATA